ncbi:MAG: hypothetical protein ACREM1_20960 [Longimicrobiales bacterium]
MRGARVTTSPWCSVNALARSASSSNTSLIVCGASSTNVCSSWYFMRSACWFVACAISTLSSSNPDLQIAQVVGADVARVLFRRQRQVQDDVPRQPQRGPCDRVLDAARVARVV